MEYHRLQERSPYLVVGLGLVLFFFAASHHATEIYAIDRTVAPLVAFALDGLPALGLAYAGFRLAGTDLAPADRWQVSTWCFVGAAAFVVIMGSSIVIRAFEGRVIGEAVFPLLIAAETGGLAGVIAGYQAARARAEARRVRARSDALRERTRQLQAVIDNVEAAIWIRDTDSRFVLVNQRLRTLLGFDAETEVVGKPLEELVSPEVAAQFRETDQEAIETRCPVEVERTIETDQEHRTLLTKITPLFEGDDVYATCGVASDITERKEYERTIERQNERLDQFASVVSHDLRNPLAVATGRLELAREEHDSDHLEHVDRSLDRMGALIEDLLTLARGDETDLTLEPVSVADLAESCWKNVETRDATVVVETDRTVRADEGRLKQVFENLVRNAVEHGGDVTVTIGDLTDGVYVEDDGPGIPKDERDDVFEAGYTTNQDGTGFGLSIVKQVVDAHDWEISLAEDADSGARFEITGVTFAD